ncbi:MAG: glycosyltransferase family 4 protein [Elusimicrobia bacterium]|nr:glycosyltransferase family 4 protein [Elusimicrobiota bacterium]
MRIVELHDESWDSGIAHYALTLAAALQGRGHEVLFWCRAKSEASRAARAAGLETREIARPWVSLPELRLELKRRGVELIDAHTGSSHSLAAALAAGTRARIVRTRGDTRPPATNVLAKALARRTHAYIAANRRLRDQLAEAFPGARVELVMQGIASLGEPAPLPSSPAIGILGRLDEVKGHSDFLAAAAILMGDFPAAQFAAAGDDPSGRLKSLGAQARVYGLDGRVKFLGRVPSARGFINGCSIGVVASTGSEAVSRAALEWMQLGRPLVATRVGCLPDLVDDGRTGLLVAPSEPKALAGALSKLLCDPGGAAQMGRLGRERFAKCFSLERFAEETERVYRSVLA